MYLKLKAGFTLIELLVVIAIIAVLSGILFPVFAHARAKARQTQCASNEQQLGTALLNYASDNDQRLPDTDPNFWRGCPASRPTPDPNTGRTQSWQGAIFPYVKTLTVFVCPQRKDLAPATTPADMNNLATDRTGYGYNGAYWMGVRNPCTAGFVDPCGKTPARDNKTGLDGYIRVTKIEDVVNTLMVADSPTNGSYQLGDTGKCGDETPSETNTPGSLPEQRHSGGFNVLFTDGHVKWLTQLSTSNPDMWSIELD